MTLNNMISGLIVTALLGIALATPVSACSDNSKVSEPVFVQNLSMHHNASHHSSDQASASMLDSTVHESAMHDSSVHDSSVHKADCDYGCQCQSANCGGLLMMALGDNSALVLMTPGLSHAFSTAILSPYRFSLFRPPIS